MNWPCWLSTTEAVVQHDARKLTAHSKLLLTMKSPLCCLVLARVTSAEAVGPCSTMRLPSGLCKNILNFDVKRMGTGFT